jgi:alpha-tubulin suppressor-like RCC1 family protein
MVFGGGEVGQLGTGMRKDLLVPTKLQAMSSIVQAACGYCHTALLTEAGEVYTCGSAMSGQLGHVRVPHIPLTHSPRDRFRSTKI